MSMRISDAIAEYERSQPGHGMLDIGVLHEIESIISSGPLPLTETIETGCGTSTILLSRLSAHHTVFAMDDTARNDGSVNYFRQCPAADPSRTTFIFGPTQLTLKAFAFTVPLDLVFLDGPHGYPFPDLEYYFTYPHLRQDGWLIVDDVHIPTIHHLYEFLREDEMFEFITLVKTTAVFKRSAAPTFNPAGDGWEYQRFNAARFPVPPTGSAAATALSEAASRLESELLSARQQIAWWQHVADERRLSVRLRRNLERVRRLSPFHKA